MVAERIQRNATTTKGILRRTKEACFEDVADPRDENRIKHPLGGALELGVYGLATGARSTRAVEKRSTQLNARLDEETALEGRMSDNAFGLLLRALEPYQLRQALHRTVKAEWTDRENLRPTDLSKSTVAIDGKNLAVLRSGELRRLVSSHTDLDGQQLTVGQLKRVYASRFPEVQLRDDDGAGLIGVVMVHRATLVSSRAAVVVDQRSIEGTSSEHGVIDETLRALFKTYGRSDLVERVTVDAGNMYKKAATEIRANKADYFGAIKSSQGTLYERAKASLGSRSVDEIDEAHFETANGKTVVYRVWTMAVTEGTQGWKGARQLVRIQRMTIDNETGEVGVGERYFVSSESPDELDALEAYRVARAHWRCENEGHWTCDAIWEEDARRTPWTKHPTGIVNVGILRVIAINILALLRAMSRRRDGDTLETPSWQTVIEEAVLALLRSALDTEEFGDFEA